MKHTLTVTAFMALIGVGSASVVINGTITNPEDSLGAPLGNGSFAALIVDTSNDGILIEGPTTLVESMVYGGDNYVAEIFASFNMPPFGNSASAGQTLNLGDSGIASGNAYFIVWFEGTAGTGNNTDTQFEAVANQKYSYATGAGWSVPTEGSTATPAAVIGTLAGGATTQAIVVPEPGAVALGLLGFLGLLRRRR